MNISWSSRQSVTSKLSARANWFKHASLSVAPARWWCAVSTLYLVCFYLVLLFFQPHLNALALCVWHAAFTFGWKPSLVCRAAWGLKHCGGVSRRTKTEISRTKAITGGQWKREQKKGRHVKSRFCLLWKQMICVKSLLSLSNFFSYVPNRLNINSCTVCCNRITLYGCVCVCVLHLLAQQ